MFSAREDGLDSRDLEHLNQNNYRVISLKYSKSYVIKHKRFPNKIVELRAASPSHAASLVGWRLRHVKLIEVKDVGCDCPKDCKGHNSDGEERES